MNDGRACLEVDLSSQDHFRAGPEAKKSIRFLRMDFFCFRVTPRIACSNSNAVDIRVLAEIFELLANS